MNQEVPENRNVLEAIEAVFLRIVLQATEGNDVTLKITPKPRWQDVGIYRGQLKQVSPSRTTLVSFRQSPMKFAQYCLLMTEIYKSVTEEKIRTKRDLYYQFPTTFKSQPVVDKIVEDIARTFNVKRSALKVVATTKGMFAGPLDIQTDSGNGSRKIASAQDGATLIPTKGLTSASLRILVVPFDNPFVLVVEKDATFFQLLERKFHAKYPQGILVTGVGHADFATRALLHLLTSPPISLPGFVLVDADPHGFEIMAVYKYGALRSRIPLTPADERKIKALLTRVYLAEKPEWKREPFPKELETLLAGGFKTELQAMDAFHPRYLLDNYLQDKLEKMSIFAADARTEEDQSTWLHC
ncbi:unnamed protein product [Cyprideis torosa]|uniref:DNA topoisomerase (ATP-hydrolyzing) n=1 Tax=Cyprideis torosa TaxID=163714 RepID=A0A7R8W0S8_9CRUS|nr:unnamed protein product [Cyprideis torosa]CAG0880071.1 unnamed protein product [Cyprideis torosa]